MATIPHGSTNRKIPFVAVDSSDLKTRETGLSSFTVRYSLDGGTDTAMTTPTVSESSAANSPGVYWLDIDESGMTTLASGRDHGTLMVHITQASMAPVTREIQIERVKFTEGELATMANSAVDADVERWLGTVVTAGTAGVPSVDVVRIGNGSAAATNLGRWASAGGNSALTADSGTTTTLVDAALTQGDADYFKGCMIVFASGTLQGQTRLITGFDPATDTLTFYPATTQAVSTHTYAIIPAAMVDVWGWLSTIAQGASGRPQVDVELWLGSAPNALSSGRLDVTVGAMQANVMTAAAAASDLTTEFQSGLATAADLAVVDGIVDAILIDTAEIGAAGAGLTAVPWNASWDAEVQSEATDALNAYDPPTKAELDAAVSPLATAAALATVDGIVDDILADTGTTLPGTLATIAGYIDTEIQTILTDIAALDTAIGALENLSASEVANELFDALWTDEFAEPTGAPPATASLGRKIGQVYMTLRNRIDITASSKDFYDDSGSIEWSKALSDDSTTYTEAEAA